MINNKPNKYIAKYNTSFYYKLRELQFAKQTYKNKHYCFLGNICLLKKKMCDEDTGDIGGGCLAIVTW